MKTTKWMLPLVAIMLAISACAPKASSPKVLILYYSQTANTRTVAEAIQARLGADMEEIVPVTPYAGSYQETIERCLQEREQGIVPEVQPIAADLSQYDIIFLGYPIWFGTYAPPMAGLLKAIDLSGKKVVPFCTFGSGGLAASVRNLATAQPDAEILPGYGVRAARMAAVPKEIDQFLKANGFLEGDFAQLEDFPEAHPVTEDEAAIFDAAVGNYPMIHAQAESVASRPLPDGVEYLFTAIDLPREGMPTPGPGKMQVYVTVENGQDPVFTQVVR